MSHGRLRSARYIVRKAGTAVWLALMILPFAARSENRLAEEKSPYLLQHRDNPVDWYPWGKEAFDRARQENKPVFVSIGYSTCHWCHVMARESFENPQTAKLLNEHFVNVKVDREERPDVDRFCMAFVQATGGSGGWPMNVWMTPEGEPFFGGTYFPPDDRPGQPGFPSVIRLVAEEWKSSEVEIRAHGGKVIDALRSSAAPPASEVSEDILSSAYKEFVRNYDPEWGGFGRGEQFPRASVFNFLLRLHATAPASPEGKAALEMIRNTLHKMASGGIRDHIGGGFHRYAVDRAWRVPHFEKMLCDQAQLAISYCEAWQVTGDPLFLDVAQDTLEYVLRELTHPEGGFFSAVDAESLVAHPAPDKPKALSICGPPLRLAMRLAPRRREYSPFTTVCNLQEMCPMLTTRAANFEAGTSLSNASPSQNPPGNSVLPRMLPGSRWPPAKKGFSPFATAGRLPSGTKRSWPPGMVS
jgi:uncharacterized protein